MYRITRIKDAVASEESADLKNVLSGGGIVWVNTIARKESDLEKIKTEFNIHPLAIEDCIDRLQRPKIEIYENCVLIIVKDPELKGSGVVAGHLALFIGKDFLITVSDRELIETALVLDWIKKLGPKTLTPDFIAYKLLDAIIDSYFPILELIEKDIEAIESEILKNPAQKRITSHIFSTRRKLLTLTKATWPAREVFSTLEKEELPFFSKNNRLYYGDIYDHVIILIDLVETYRDLVSGILETYLSAVSNSMNHIIKVLTVVSTIFLPLTLVASIYGMNFQGGSSFAPLNMPELYWQLGYPFSLMLMLAISIGMLYYFRRKGWF